MRHWLLGAASALISGSASAFLNLNVIPGVTSDHQWSTYGISTLIGGLIGVANYFLQSPLVTAEKVITDAQ